MVFFAVLLASAAGKVCVVSGDISGTGTYTTSTECYDEVSKIWYVDLLLSVPNLEDSEVGFNLGEIACITGPNTPLFCSNGSAPWQALPGPTPRTGATAIYGPDWVGIVAGSVAGWQLTPVTASPWGTVTMGSFMPSWTDQYLPLVLNSTLDAATVIGLNGTSCVAGGGIFGLFTGTRDVACINTAAVTWSKGPLLTTPRYGAIPIHFNGQSCLLGGRTDVTTTWLNTMECVPTQLTPGQATFTLLPVTYPRLISESANVTLDGWPCVAGGRWPAGALTAETWCWNGTEWFSGPPLNYQRQEHASILFGPASTFSPTTSPTRAPTISPTITPTLAPTLSPTLGPSWSPTTTPSTAPTRSPSMAPATAAPSLPVVSSTPKSDQAVVVVSVQTNGTLTATQALFIITQLFRQLNLSAPDPSTRISLVQSQGPATGPNNHVAVISIVVSEESAAHIDSVLTTTGTHLSVNGYTLDVSLEFPSLVVVLKGLKLWHILLVCGLLLLLLLLLVVLHLRKHASSHLPCFLGVSTSIFSFFSHAWFLYGLEALSFHSPSAHQRQVLLPYFWGFLAALLLPVLANAGVLYCYLGRLRRADPEFNKWAFVHCGSLGFASFLGLFAVGNVAAVSSPVWGTCMSAPMSKVTRASLAASGVIGSVLEVPRLAIQVTLAVLFHATYAVTLPLLLGSLFLLSSLLQRIYFLGYVKGNKPRVNNQGTEMAMFHGY